MSTNALPTENTNLMAAANEWNRRPADERFWSIAEMGAVARRQRENSVELELPVNSLRFEDDNGSNLLLIDGDGDAARLSFNAHRQLSSLLGMPADYVGGLPTSLALRCYQHGLKTRIAESADENLAFLLNTSPDDAGDPVLRAVTSTRYGRIWNVDVALEAHGLVKDWGWVVPPARPAGVEGEQTRVATPADCIERWASHSLAIRPGQTIAPAGIYLTNNSGFSPELFVLMVNPESTIEGPGGRVLTPFVMLKNSEASYGKFEATGGLLDFVCGNHILWGASLLFEVSVRHVGSAFERAKPMLEISLAKYHALLNDAEATFTPTIQAAQRFVLPGDDAAAVVANVAGLLRLPKKLCLSAYEKAAEVGSYGPPNTAWAMVNGFTEVSQQGRQLAERHEIDLAAGKLLQLAVKRTGGTDALSTGMELVRMERAAQAQA